MTGKSNTLLIIPAYNEAANIENVIENISKNYPQYDYVIINDGSSDGTSDICDKNGYNVVNLPINLGIGGAVQTGYRYAQKYKYDIAVQIDGDGQHDISYVEEVIKPLIDDRADVVIGSRFLMRKGFQSSPLRRAGICCLSNLIWICVGKKVKDVTSCFRAVNKKYISVYANDYPYDYPEPEAIITAVMHCGRVIEVPVIMQERENGVSSISLWKSVYYMIKVTLAILVKRISYGIRR